jgi:hypothetical protein
MHLAGEPNARDLVRGNVGVAQCLANRDGAGPPPILGLLFGPSDLRRCERRVLFGRGCEYAALLIDDESARAAGANVNAE